MYFKDKQVDLAVCEVGLGGLLDATNIIEKPLISVITQIDFDHMSSLGNTLELIAQQKAGIIKKNCPVVLGAEAKPLEIFQKITKIKEAPLYQTKHDSFSNYDYNLENNLTVEKSFQIINKYYPEFKLNQSSLEKALQQNQMCRFEEIKNEIVLKKPSLLTRPFKIFFDVGHNPSGIQKTLQRIKHYFPDKKITIAVGFSMNKEIQDSLLEISKKADKVYFLKANHYRAMDLELMKNQIQQTKNIIDNQHIFQPIIQEANIFKTLQTVFEQSQSNEIVLITGSFYLMAEARQFIGYEDLKDPMELQERVIAQENIKTN